MTCRKDKKKAIEAFKGFHREVTNDQCMEVEDRKRITDNEAVEIIKRTCNIKSSQELQNVDIEKRNRYIKHLKEQGLSTRQLERLTGISRMIIIKV